MFLRQAFIDGHAASGRTAARSKNSQRRSRDSGLIGHNDVINPISHEGVEIAIQKKECKEPIIASLRRLQSDTLPEVRDMSASDPGDIILD